MTDQFGLDRMKDLFDDLDLNLEKSPWSKAQGIQGWVKQLQKETNELVLAVEKGDMLNFDEELGDVLWCWYSLLRAGHGNLPGIAQHARSKLHKRKPWIFDEGLVAPTTPEEENTLYEKMKRGSNA